MLYMKVADVAQCWTEGQQFNWSYTLSMIHTKIYLISPGCPRSSTALRTVQNRGLKHQFHFCWRMDYMTFASLSVVRFTWLLLLDTLTMVQSIKWFPMALCRLQLDHLPKVTASCSFIILPRDVIILHSKLWLLADLWKHLQDLWKHLLDLWKCLTVLWISVILLLHSGPTT